MFYVIAVEADNTVWWLKSSGQWTIYFGDMGEWETAEEAMSAALQAFEGVHGLKRFFVSRLMGGRDRLNSEAA